MIGGVWPTHFLKRPVEDLTPVIHLQTQHRERASMDIPALAHPRHVKASNDVTSRKVIGIDDGCHAGPLEGLDDKSISKLVVLNPGDSLFGTHRFSQHTQAQVQVLILCHRDKQVGIFNPSIPERLDGRVGRRLDCQQITLGRDAFQFRLILINDDDTLLNLGEQFSQMSTYCISTYYNDFHIDYSG